MVVLKEGDPAPAINAVDQDGKRITLEEYRGKRVVLYFYPKDNTPDRYLRSYHINLLKQYEQRKIQ